jgi:hypothetical protein
MQVTAAKNKSSSEIAAQTRLQGLIVCRPEKRLLRKWLNQHVVPVHTEIPSTYLWNDGSSIKWCINCFWNIPIKGYILTKSGTVQITIFPTLRTVLHLYHLEKFHPTQYMAHMYNFSTYFCEGSAERSNFTLDYGVMYFRICFKIIGCVFEDSGKYFALIKPYVFDDILRSEIQLFSRQELYSKNFSNDVCTSEKLETLDISRLYKFM